MIRPEPLEESHVVYLAGRVREADILDLKTHESTALEALTWALKLPGKAWAVMDGDTPIGAGGFTEAGSIWTLWRDLTLGQYREVLRMAAPWCRIMAILAKRPLSNVYLKGNRTTERFLKATGCIDILEQEVYHDGRTWIPFFLKPLERMPNV